MNQIKKVVTCQVKEMPDHMMEFVGSCETPDRMGDRVHADGWQLDNYRKNPVFLWAHDYKQLPIGKAVDVAPSEGKLLFRVQFANHPFAETVYQLYKGGFLNAVSVGFAPLDFAEYHEGDKGGYDYIKQELMELSACPVPAHPDALVTARSQGLITVKEFEVITKPEETEDYFRVPVPKEEGKHDDHRIRTIDISEKDGIKALYCGECKTNITYLFSKESKYGWTMEKARGWVKEHSKSVSQAEIRDEIDFLDMMITESGIAAGVTRENAIKLAHTIWRLAGCDNPDDIQAYQRIISLIDNKIGGR